MTNPAMFLVMQQLRKFADECRSASAQVARAGSLREVRDWGRVQPGSLISGLKHQVPELRQLERRQEERATSLVDEQLTQLKALALAGDKAGFDRRLGQLRQNDWVFLRGDHPGILHKIERELARIEHESGPGRAPRGPGGP